MQNKTNIADLEGANSGQELNESVVSEVAGGRFVPQKGLDATRVQIDTITPNGTDTDTLND